MPPRAREAKAARPPAGRIIRLARLALAPVRAHGGRGRIGFHRPFAAADFAAPIDFVDYAELPPGASIGRHRHGADEELYLVLSGRGRMHLDGREFDVGPGTLIHNRPGGTHGLVNVGRGALRVCVVQVAVVPRRARVRRARA